MSESADLEDESREPLIYGLPPISVFVMDWPPKADEAASIDPATGKPRAYGCVRSISFAVHLQRLPTRRGYQASGDTLPGPDGMSPNDAEAAYARLLRQQHDLLLLGLAESETALQLAETMDGVWRHLSALGTQRMRELSIRLYEEEPLPPPPSAPLPSPGEVRHGGNPRT